MKPKRVHELITCPQIVNGTYDESRHGGHAAEALLGKALAKHGFRPQVEIEHRGVVGHPDFVKIDDEYIEFIEVKNTGQISYTHVLQASMYKSMLHKIHNKPVIGYMLYVKFRTVFGDNPTVPSWAKDLGMNYVFLPIDGGENYVNWGVFRTSFKSKLAGPYCIHCRNTECKIKQVILNGPNGMLNVPEE
jgi:hypothetical protein